MRRDPSPNRLLKPHLLGKRSDREENTKVNSIGQIYQTYFSIRRGHFSQNKIMFVSDLHLRSEQSYGIILFGYPYERYSFNLFGPACRQMQPHLAFD